MRLTAALHVLVAVCFAIAQPATAAEFNREKFDDAGFVSIFDGKTLKGWHVSAKTGHSGASDHKTGGRWVVEDGAIIGSQDTPGNGGIVITDKQPGSTASASWNSKTPKIATPTPAASRCKYTAEATRLKSSSAIATSA